MDKVATQFNKLKLQCKINIATKVKIAKVDNFKAGYKKSKTILYNENMNELLDDEIDFWLLHEEGHFINLIKKSHMFCLSSISVFEVIMAIILYFSHYGGLLSFTIYVILLFSSILIFLFLAYIWMRFISQNNEYEADDFACNNIDNPLGIISVFEHTRNLLVKEKHLVKRLFSKCSQFTHPSDNDRISRIKENLK